jgi:hypothetical protein
MKIYSFSEAKALITPPDQMWEKIQHDIINLPKDAIDSINEWKGMYEQYSTGQGIQDTVKNAFWDALSDIGAEIVYFFIDYGYWVALFGGLAAILLYICGHRGALKWVWTLIIGYVFICALGGAI